jgi:hypothetical protein
MPTFVDGAGAVRDWINAQTGTLVGAGAPLWLGATLKYRGGAADRCYGLIVELPGYLWAGAETPSFGQRISLEIFGPTKEATALAAGAYGDALIPLVAGVPAMLTSGVTILCADSVAGPTWVPNGDEPRYVVDADFAFA